MNCKEARRILLNPGRGKSIASRQEQARGHLATCPLCQAGLNRLAAEIEREEQLCAEIQEMLPLYLKAEIAGQPVEEKYAPVWRHLTQCSLCTQAYSELRTLLEAEPEAPSVIYPALDLPFLRSPSPARRAVQWAIETTTDALGHISATITFSKAYLAAALSPPSLSLALRSGKSVSPTPKHFPLPDILLEDVSWLVSLEAIQEEAAPPQPERWHLQVSVARITPASRIQVRLSDSQAERVMRLDEKGIAVFRDVPVHWIKGNEIAADDRLRVELQQVESE